MYTGCFFSSITSFITPSAVTKTCIEELDLMTGFLIQGMMCKLYQSADGKLCHFY